MIPVTAIICTHNRANYLRKSLPSLVEQTLPKDEYEVIVIDNASTDKTAQIAKDYTEQLSNFSYIYEPKLGLSQARNTGWQNASGKIVAFLDDDAIADPQWLETIVATFEARPDIGCLAGKIDPIWEAPRPSWLHDRLVAYLTVLDWSDEPIYLSKQQWLAGANMAVPRALLEAVGGFDPELDRRGKILLSDGDTYLSLEIENLGYPRFYHPGVLVGHHASVSRLTQEWLIERAYWQGVSDAFSEARRESLTSAARRARSFLISGRLLLSPRFVFFLKFSTQNPEHFYTKCQAWRKLGRIVGLSGKYDRSH